MGNYLAHILNLTAREVKWQLGCTPSGRNCWLGTQYPVLAVVL